MPGSASTHRSRRAKRALDLVLGGALLLAVAPLLLGVALLVRLECRSAPVLFRQARTGLGGRRFQILKFRTMVPDAEARKAELRALSEVTWPDFRLHADPRVTPLGRVLRRSSIDELPQLWNVVRGDMSLVGPRPTSFGPETYAIWQTERLEFKPGLTGPFQVDGRTSMEFTDRCRAEIRFFRHATLRSELALLARTALVVVRRTGTA
ncbi:MAG: Undecaprenyl-phosphate galactose phosphotransferase [Solirubrobacterales bacterium]|jgi:lipopolysaccharide/colanic/teichoic acid biosynthesis glycosyltransferase|nr:Undecaprenyl-phosphate galactose phosphotransferase [Solirubrobacterales bacterium]